MAFIELHQVSKIIKHRELLHQVNAEIERGSITTLEGINGSGKTLILKALLGLMTVTGDVSVAGKSVNVQEAYPIKAGILIENPSLIDDFSAYKNLELLARLDTTLQPKQIHNLLDYFELTRFPEQKVRKFSLGMKQKLGITEAFLGGYPLIILDEPTNALDHNSIIKLIQLIQAYNANGSTFIIASHDHDFVEQVATHKLFVKEGTISHEI